jgi:hypothetical protein
LYDQLNDLFHVLLQRVDDRVRAGIVSVCGLDWTPRVDGDPVVFHDEGDNRSADIVHVEDRRFGVQSDCVELVRILHRNLCEGVEVASLMASEISFMRSGTMCSIRCWRRAEVSTVRCIPDVEEVPFLSSETTQMRACISGQCSRGATSTARESEPSGDDPISHATKPPKRDRQADPDPWRAINESSDGVDGSW